MKQLNGVQILVCKKNSIEERVANEKVLPVAHRARSSDASDDA